MHQKFLQWLEKVRHILQTLIEKITDNKRQVIAVSVFALVLVGVAVASKKSETVSRFLASVSGNVSVQNNSGQAGIKGGQVGKTSVSPAAAKICDFNTSLKPDKNAVVFKEVAWMGNKDSANNEWLSIQKISEGDVEIGGYQILNENQKIKIILPAKAVLTGAKPLYVLARTDGISGIAADQIYSGAIRNTNEGLRLFSGDCRLLDEVFAKPNWPAGDNASKQTMKRDLGTLAWFNILPVPALASGAGGQNAATDDKSNSSSDASQTSSTEQVLGASTATASATASTIAATSTQWCSQNNLTTPTRAVLINEVAWAGVASDKTSREWEELKNSGGSEVALAGWQMQNKSATIKILFGGHDAISANGFYLLEREYDDTIPGIKADKVYVGALKNNDESLRLFDSGCRLIDEVVANIGNAKNWPAGTASPDYRTAERSADLSWHTYSGNGSQGIFGTPRAENSPPPVPVSSAPPAAANPPPVNNPSPTPAPVYYTLSVAKNGTGTGSVTGSSVSCGQDCAEDYLNGAAVELTAVAADGSEFADWTGDCSGAGICQVTMDATRTVGAVFNLIAAEPSPAPPPIEPSPPPSPSPSPTPSSSPPRVLLAEIMPRSQTSANDAFIVLYNAGGQDADLSGWTIKKKSSTGSESDLVTASHLNGKTVAAGRYFLLANDGGYTGTAAPDAVWAHSNTLASAKNAVTVYDKNGTAADTASWTSIPAGKSYARVSWDSSGFVVQDTASPKNSSGN